MSETYTRYPFEYFCGANVVVYLGDFPLLEASGFSYSIRESKRPIYGYSSRHFDAVARGQILVEGTLLINYVHQDYLYYAAKLALGADPAALKAGNQADKGVIGGNTELTSVGTDAATRVLQGNEHSAEDIEALRTSLWREAATATPFDGLARTSSLHDSGGFELRVSFGNATGSRPAGDTGLLIRRVHFTGRAQTIQIDAETIVEAYSFFARDISSTQNPPPPIQTVGPGGTTEVST